jgi:c-di-GMP-binding flagellar brake protein YcgR
MHPERRYKRYKVDVLKISGKMVLAKNVTILNISIGGLALRTDKKLSVGGQCRVTIEGKSTTFTEKGAVVWSFLTETVKDDLGNVIPIYTAGIQFVNLTDEKIREISAFIEAHFEEEEEKVESYKQTGKRLYVRFSSVEKNQATIFFHEKYIIKNLSLGGMLIESEHALEIDKNIQMEIFLLGDEHINLTGRVASCIDIAGEVQKIFDIGIEFVSISEDSIKKLESIIQLLQNMESDFSVTKVR